MRVEVGDGNSANRENVGNDEAEQNKRQAGRLQVAQPLTGRHAHFQQEQTQYALEQVDQERIIDSRHIRTLQSADVAHDDSAEQQVEARIQEDLVQNFGTENALRLGSRRELFLGYWLFGFFDRRCRGRRRSSVS